MKHFSKQWVVFLLCLGFWWPQHVMGESFLGYQEEIQKIFLREAARPSQFKKAVQTARLLGYLEFLAVESFGGFYTCLKKEKRWRRLSSKKRERLLNNCRAKGRVVSSARRVPPAAGTAVRPADQKRQEQMMNQVQGELSELRRMMERLSKDVRNNHDRLTEKINSLSTTSTPETETF